MRKGEEREEGGGKIVCGEAWKEGKKEAEEGERKTRGSVRDREERGRKDS